MPLDRFGFTRTQDTVYKSLLRLGTATGYAIARDTKLARANVYQALDALADVGLARARGDRPVTYTALAATAAMERLAGRFEHDLAGLAGELGLPATTRRTRRDPGAGFDRLDGRDALVAAATAAADAAEHEVLAVIGPWVGSLTVALERARGRRVTWKVVSLGAPAPDGAFLRPVAEEELTAYWGGLPMVIVCDRAHAVCGILSGDGVTGVQTRSAGVVPFLRHLLRRELASAGGARPS